MRNPTRIWLPAILFALAVTACGDDDEGICDADELADELASAAPGQAVTVGRCTVTVGRTLSVPPGVILEGISRDASRIVGPNNITPVELAPVSEGNTQVRRLTVVSQGPIGILARGAGRVAISDVRVEASAGLAIGAAEVSNLSVHDAELIGPAAEGLTVVELPEAHGLVLVDVAQADISEVSAHRFTAFGAFAHGGSSTWRDVTITDNYSVGLMVESGTATISDSEVCRTGYGGGFVVYGAVFSAGAEVQSSGLTVCDGDGVGVFHNQATGSHENIVVTGNEDVGIWIQDVDSFELHGTASRLSDNRFAGLAALESSHLDIRDVQIEDTRLGTTIQSGSAPIEFGDGVQLSGSTEDVQLEGLTLVDNSRVGLLIDLGGGDTSEITITDVTVEASGEQLGAIAQNGTTLSGWDDGVSRSTALGQSDAAFSGELDVLDLVGPNNIPQSDAESLVGPNN